MIGTFYRASNPKNDPFIKEGDIISEGQTICIIEAMKLFNEVESEVSGKVIKILVDDTSPVEKDKVPRAISIILLGGIVSAFLGPSMANYVHLEN